ncbi:MAG TPA: DUF3810 domain-containing protein, partial [Fusibacter sp.]|nr:DUF3810 domain-containing protein [Fusibacter sp.]
FASGINKWTIELMSLVTGFFKYSIAEFVLYGHVLAAPIVAILLIIKLFKGGLLKSILRILQYLSVLYVAFMLLWGFNYNRISISEIMGFEVMTYSTEELAELTESLIASANTLRIHQLEDSEGVMVSAGTYKEIFARAHEGYNALGKSVKALSGPYGRPKPVFASELMLYTGITGVYFPYTAEANVNVAVPDLLLPATTLHEMAHQRGIAPEDEANFVAYLTAIKHPDKDFNYSGTVLALIHTMNALYAQDSELAMTLRKTYSEGLDRDMAYYSRFWKAYEGRTNEVADQVNDTYLKASGETEGVKSYGLMVDLLLGYYYSMKP